MNQATVQRMKDLRQIADDAIAQGQAQRRALGEVWNEVMQPADAAEQQLRAAVSLVDGALARYQFEIDKVNRLIATTQGNPGMMQALKARPYDEALRAALVKSINKDVWTKLQKSGSSATKINTLLDSAWPHYDGYVESKRPGVQTIYRGSPARFWFERAPVYHGEKEPMPTLQSFELCAEVMRVMKIPNEADLHKKENAAAQGPVDEQSTGSVDSKSSRPSKGKKNSGGTKEPAAPAAPAAPRRSGSKRPSKKSSSKKAERSVSTEAAYYKTYNQWLMKVKEHGGPSGLTPDTANPKLWQDWFDNGVEPRRAAELWKQIPSPIDQPPKAKPNGHAAPEDPASIGAAPGGAFAIAGA